MPISVLRGSLIRSQQAFPLAETTSVADPAASRRPSRSLVSSASPRSASSTTASSSPTALAPGAARRRAFDAALQEIEDGAKVPSTGWRRRFSLLLGLERLLSEDEPHLADGTLLNPHQVDALSGTLTALLAEASATATRRGRRAGRGRRSTSGRRGAEDDDDEDDDEDEDEEEDGTTGRRRRGRRRGRRRRGAR